MSQVDIYAQPDIPYKIKRKMRCLLEYGISKEDVSLCISDKFNLDQVYEICMGFEFGLSRAQVEKYADKLVKLSAENDLPDEIKETIDLLTHAVRQD